MYAVCVTFHIRLDAVDQFLTRMHQQARDSLSKEEDCYRFDVCSDVDRPGVVFLYELYKDRNAFDEHSRSDHFLSFNSEVAPLTLEKAVSTFQDVSVGLK
ncbi:MAG: antibiotic biosynthesis monooxygenase [Boseongicola sp.]|nr:antibiotic biosynthesis monooxygenase [Boseongicola sp.]NNJ69539.1 antibiotic biosynthesis monooxygenase [Boseongicola sp.]